MEKNNMPGKFSIRTPYDLSLSQLRHSQVFKLIGEFKVTSLLDLGCSKGQFLRLAARSARLKLLAGLDIDEEALKEAIVNALPEPLQMSLQFDRQEDLLVEVFQGNLLRCYRGLRQRNFEMVSMIEVIEHLRVQDVDRAVNCVWGYLRPSIVVVTTPNKQFNVHFSNTPEKLRHWDHKFQWTREQFGQFCQKVAQKYRYQYEISGIGEHVSDTSKGCCTQMAVFIAKQPRGLASKQTISEQCQQGLIKKESYLIECWRSRLDCTMKDLFYRGLQHKEEASFSSLLATMNKHPLAHCLGNQHIELNEKFIKSYILKFGQCFEWDELHYRLRPPSYEGSSSLQNSEVFPDYHEFGFKQQNQEQ